MHRLPPSPIPYTIKQVRKQPMSEDNISRIICESLNVRAYGVNTLNLVREITKIHETTPNATVALGRTLTATALLSATLKPDSNQNISLIFSGSGPIGEIVAQADAKGNIRGYVSNPLVDITADIDKISFSQTIGAGFLTVTKDIGMKEPYKSLLPLQTGEVASEIAYYLTTSEQIPSALILGLDLDKNGEIASSGGILIQTFPDTDEEVVALLENKINKQNHSIGEELKDGKDVHSLISEFLDNEPLTVIDTHPIKATCRCNKEMLFGVLKTLNKNELEEMIHEDKGAEIVCSFCRSKYQFNEGDLTSLLHMDKH